MTTRSAPLLLLALGATLQACGPALAEPPQDDALTTAEQHLDDDPDWNDPEDPLPDAGTPVVKQSLAGAMQVAGFTPTSPATWSFAKRVAICQRYAANVAHRYQQAAFHATAQSACWTGKAQELPFWAYQTEEMRRAGFQPSSPSTWTPQRRADICTFPRLAAYRRLQLHTTAALAWNQSSGIQAWCELKQPLMNVDGEKRAPPTPHELATWEFSWWRQAVAP